MESILSANIHMMKMSKVLLLRMVANLQLFTIRELDSKVVKVLALRSEGWGFKPSVGQSSSCVWGLGTSSQLPLTLCKVSIV